MRQLNWRSELFRPSRPDSIETLLSDVVERGAVSGLFRPSRPDSIETGAGGAALDDGGGLFRPSRPDSIETQVLIGRPHDEVIIVPAF